ncbi:sarcosine oxidase subunit alpha family protein [Ruegeria arenilitoris]|uniref:sarcosine oxidase subunit alpha family protein n=1 Tax=Ruegeria arenilitoris TaxID=1173585 RepID=UPI0014815317|nr:sarcosine oxidase subunit alpha family protein [Ruegeria arenilitoris]
MTQLNRLNGGLISRGSPLNFTFDGKEYAGYQGDTLASALLANGVRLMGRSFKYHRPRGVIASGSEEPNALVELRTRGRQEPNTRATVTELFGGLSARSQNRFPSLKHDFMAINDRLSNFLSAGFYYKTFMWPAPLWEKLYEPIIRKAAGLGSVSLDPDPDTYEHGYLHCDLLIVGSGPAGLAAALTAARAGARVVLAEEDFEMGGRLIAESSSFVNQSGAEWVAGVLEELGALPNVRLMKRATVHGAYDHGTYGVVERVADHLAEPPAGTPRQIHWRIYARKAVLCAGATERPIAFENNDRPGIMLAGAVRAYVNRWAAAPAQTVAVFTNNDDGHRTAKDLLAKDVNVSAVIDVRHDAPDVDGAELFKGAQVVDSTGKLGLESVKLRLSNGEIRTIDCGALAVSGGWNPNVHLTCHQRGRPIWDDEIAAFVPDTKLPVGLSVAGAANGVFSTAAALKTGMKTAKKALLDLDIQAPTVALPEAEDSAMNLKPFWFVKEGRGRAWLDYQNDVTVKDVRLAHQEGYKSPEHLKRYTTLGMATDQGKTANVLGLAVMSEMTGASIPETGTTIFRPPYTPIALGTLAGSTTGRHLAPTRKTPSHVWAQELGAEFVEAGNWLRARWFKKPGEKTWQETVNREVTTVRSRVGLCDVSTLGKIDVQGTDAAEFLNKVYANAFAKLPVGKTRYGLMLREDGIVYDDGTAARLAEDHFVVTTTTANAVLVYRNMEFARQCLWPELDVQLISTTEAWAQYAVAGPRSRDLLRKIVDAEFDISNEAFPFMACGEITVCGGFKARLFRISFSGELAYEIAVPRRYGDALIRALMAAGEEFGVAPYGTEALDVLRIEKGHAIGNELNGTTTALNLGLGKMVNRKKDCIGQVLSTREELADPEGLRLVGFKPVNRTDKIVGGAHLMNKDEPTDIKNDQGYITSAGFSATLGHSIAIGFLKNGSGRIGELVRAVNPLQESEIEVEVVSAHFVDPEGDRLRA